MVEKEIRSTITKLVSSVIPLDEEEESHIRYVLEWLNSDSQIFRIEKPANPATHLVSYFVVVSPEMDKILLVDHKKAELWLPPGGHVEVNEDPKQTVIREAREELGIEADFILEEPLFLTISETSGSVVQSHFDVSLWYLIKLDPEQMLDYDKSEFHRIGWFSLDDIPFEKTDPYLKRFLQKMSDLIKIQA